MKLWEYESGRKLQSWDLKELQEAQSSEAGEERKPAVCRITSSPDGHHIAVQCERLCSLQFFSLHQGGGEGFKPCSRLTLPHCPLDVTFDLQGRLWVLLDCKDDPLQMYSHRRGSWELDAESPDITRVTEAFRPHWQMLHGSVQAVSHFEHLYKANFDNVASYMQKKQQRLQQQQKRKKTKHSSLQETNGAQSCKKTKMETSGAGTQST